MQQKQSYVSLFLLFLKFGLFAWGGPHAQIAMIKEELVDKREWITLEKFRHVLALYQALPGPEAHELCVYFGMIRQQRLGGFLAGLGFMLPGFVFILLLSWCYQFYGAKVLFPLFAGIVPAVVALMMRATYRLSFSILHNLSLWITALMSVVLTFLEVNFLYVFVICVLWQTIWKKGYYYSSVLLGILLIISALSVLPEIHSVPSLVHNGNLFTEGLKAGLLSFGGAYTAIPFLQENMVGIYPNITQQLFFDGIALANMIPAPLVIFGTYLGFMAGGIGGALWMTAGIFLPAFSFTLIGHDYLEKIVTNPVLHNILDTVSAATIGILAVTTWNIFFHNITDIKSFGLLVIALLGLCLIKNKWAVPMIILFCGCVYHIL